MIDPETSDKIDEVFTDDSHSVVSPSTAQISPAWKIRTLNAIPPSLKTWNLAAAVFQFVQAIALFYLSSQAETPWRLFTNFPAVVDDDQRQSGSEAVGEPIPSEIAAYSVTWYSAVFILLSGIDHLACVIFKSSYQFYIERHQNPFRWLEYAFSASLMRVMIAQLSGVTDVHLLGCIYVLAAVTMIMGGLHESANAKFRADGGQQNWAPFLLAWIPHAASWAVIMNYFLKAVIEADPPNFVYAIVFILFILDGTFALLFWLQWAKIGIFKDYVVGEKGFILLSFTAKALLAWINYGGGSR